MKTINLNADLGEGIGYDEAIIPLISSANIACGEHAGNPEIMRTTLQLCKKHQVAAGAHPSFPDRHHFGRRELTLPDEELRHVVRSQVLRLMELADEVGIKVQHVKPHGALYNMAARDERIATIIASAIFEIDTALILFGPPNSFLNDAGVKMGLPVAREGFADRLYQDDGSLTPRAHPGAVIIDPDKVVEQALQMAIHQQVITSGGHALRLSIDSICVHGDTTDAATLARLIREALLNENFTIAPPRT